MATAAYNASIAITGTSTALTAAPGEPMTDVSGGAKTVWQITNAAKRIVDPATAIVIYDDNTGAPWAGTFTIDYFFGTVTLNVAAATTIKIQGNYLPRSVITNAYEYNISMTRGLAETSVFSTGHTLRTRALSDISGSISCYDNTSTSYSGMTLKDVFDSATAKVLEVDMGTTVLRAFVLMESSELSSAVDGVQTLSSNFQASGVVATTTGQEVDYGFSV